jgi:hypothetical protein
MEAIEGLAEFYCDAIYSLDGIGPCSTACSGRLSHELCFPVPGKKVRQARHGHVGQPSKDIGQPGLRIDVVHLGGDDEGIHEGGAFATAGRTGEEPRLATKSDTTQGALSGIVGEADATILKEEREGVPAALLLEHVVYVS